MTAVVFIGAGCFWGVEARLAALPGVVDTRVGYMGEPEAEVVRVRFDPARTDVPALLRGVLERHDPTRARPARYRSAVFVTASDQARLARSVLPPGALTEIAPAGAFREAAERHQNWAANRAADPRARKGDAVPGMAL